MFKFNKSFTWAVLACTALCGGLTSCDFGNDDDDDDPDNNVPEDLWQGELPDAKFENDAVFFNIRNRERYSSIELTSSGNYIAMPVAQEYSNNSDTRAVKSTGLAGMFRSHGKATRYEDGSNYENAIFGTYTKGDDGSYNLQGLGVLFILNESTIQLHLNDGTILTFEVDIQYPVVDGNTLNNRMCRTWGVVDVYEEAYDSKGTRIMNKKLTQQEIMDEYVQYVVMSKAGTFTQVDWDNSLDSYGRWWWDSENLQIFGYLFVDEDGSGSCGVKFNGDRAEFFETYYGTFDDLEDYGYDSTSRYDGYLTFQTRIVCQAR